MTKGILYIALLFFALPCLGDQCPPALSKIRNALPGSVLVEIEDPDGVDSLRINEKKPDGTLVPKTGAKLGFEIDGNEAFVVGRVRGDTRYSQTTATNKL